MHTFISGTPREWRDNVFRAVGDDWMLITAGQPGHLNTMTASWGGFGVLWNRDVSLIFVRPTRYTYEFLEREEYYSLSFLDADRRAALQLCGTRSGRDGDKVAAAGLTPRTDAAAPYFDEADRVMICRKLYARTMDPAAFTDAAPEAFYAAHDYHRLYVGEIVEMKTRA